MPFDRLIRFVDEEDNVRYGNLKEALVASSIIGLDVEILSGGIETDFQPTGTKARVKKLLTPIDSVPMVICSGLNYHDHIKETNSIQTQKPVWFMTPPDRLSGPLDDIIVHEEAQVELDYEGELAYVLSKDVKDVKEEDALDYILGYAIGNDVSARNLVAMEVNFNQMGHSKSFDTFGPLGPCIASRTTIPDPHRLQLTTRVNGKVRQSTNTSDMVFPIAHALAWLSKNRTLRRGTVFFTGTPSGVAWHTDGLLKHGDVVEVEISGIGSIANRVHFV